MGSHRGRGDFHIDPKDKRTTTSISEPTDDPNGQTRTNGQPRTANRAKASSKQTADLIQQAESLKASLRTALIAARELIRGLRRQRKQSRLVQSTLASLRQLQGVR